MSAPSSTFETLFRRTSWFTWFTLAWVAGVLTAVPADPPSSGSATPLEQWLQRSHTLKSWEAHFVQTRHLKALTHPLTTPGRVWFLAPDRFRWELGEPVQSLVLRDGSNLQVLSPRLRRVEEISLTNAAGPLREAMALLDSGFPRDAAAFHRQFKLLSSGTNQSAGGVPVHAFRLQPKASGARRFLPELVVEVTVADLQLTATELQFTDGSRMRNDFTAAILNPGMDPGLFRTNLDASWKKVGPGGTP